MTIIDDNQRQENGLGRYDGVRFEFDPNNTPTRIFVRKYRFSDPNKGMGDAGTVGVYDIAFADCKYIVRKALQPGHVTYNLILPDHEEFKYSMDSDLEIVSGTWFADEVARMEQELANFRSMYKIK